MPHQTHSHQFIADIGVLMKKFRMLRWRSLGILSSAVIVATGTAGCRSTPVAMQPLMPHQQPAAAAHTTDANPTDGPQTDDPTVAATNAQHSVAAEAGSDRLSLESSTPLPPAEHGSSRTASTTPPPGTSRPVPRTSPAVASAQQPVTTADPAWDVVDATPVSGRPDASDWSTTGLDGETGASTEPIQLTGHETAPVPAPPRLVPPGHATRVQGPTTQQVGGVMPGQGDRPGCNDCLPDLSDWQQQLQEQTDTLAQKVDQLEDQLEASREALKTVNAALETSNRELSRLGNDVRFWRGEVKRIESVMERQHQQDIKSLDALSETLEHLIRDDYQTSQSPAEQPGGTQ